MIVMRLSLPQPQFSNNCCKVNIFLQIKIVSYAYKNLAHAEDAAVEDALYFLGESLRRGVLDCESFLKHVRNLSRYG